jgi:hypothetical protein
VVSFGSLLGVISALLLAGSACSEPVRAPSELADGSRARQLPVGLGGIDRPAVLTMTQRPGRKAEIDALIWSCADQGWSRRPSGRAVLRVGVEGISVTLGDGSSTGVYACDATFRSVHGRTWCGVAFGHRVEGRLMDPRLDLGGCSSATDRLVAFAWIEPENGTRYVVVHHDGFAEAYEVAAGLPVRVTTTENVDRHRSRATFDVSEHAASGALRHRYLLTAVVSG